MVREQFNDEDNLNIADPHARSYIARLIYRTVVENPPSAGLRRSSQASIGASTS
jgi:hypothetical protein